MGPMRSRRRIRYLAILVLALVFTIQISCQKSFVIDQYDPGYSPGDFEETGTLTMEPSKILALLAQGEVNVFTPVSATPEAYTPLPAGTFSWSQQDYLMIADAAFRYVWKDSPDKWRAYQMLFVKRGCENNPEGFDVGHLVYFRSIEVDGEDRYVARDVTITPLIGSVTWGKTWTYPASPTWRYIDLDSVRVTADDALKIAEENGGRNIRLDKGNGCSITVDLTPEGDYRDWRVTYLDDRAHLLLGINIDPQTGGFRIEQIR